MAHSEVLQESIDDQEMYHHVVVLCIVGVEILYPTFTKKGLNEITKPASQREGIRILTLIGVPCIFGI